MYSPAVEFIAAAGCFVEISFKAFRHIVAIAPSPLSGCNGSMMGACTIAADEHGQCFKVNLLSELSQEMGI